MGEADPHTIESTSTHKKLLAVTQRRLEKFVSLFAKVLVSDHPDTIHDARVWSRRLQEAFRVLFPQPRVGKGRKLVRTLRQVRRALGNCRNTDVTIGLIEDKLDSAKASTSHTSWSLVKDYLNERRERQIARAREELAEHDITQFVTRTQSLLQPNGLQQEPEELLKRSVEGGLAAWSQALREAQENPQVDQIHALRIAGKRLRYRAELLAELGDATAKPRVKALKVLQDRLGDWHDRTVLLQLIAEFISRPDFLIDHPAAGRALLAEMERERHKNDTAATAILKSAEKARAAWGEPHLDAAQEATP
ncbi:MAG TPA: CHAD domain-containing protein [Candidatus Binatia bacterium]|nr:CHAD domain-containing protein [Candidatus Binatia bacterium]